MRENCPLILLPGTLCTELIFRHQVMHLADLAEPHVLPLIEGESVTQSASWVLNQAPERFALAGFSQGAIIGLEIVRQAPERVIRLCLLDANPRAATEAQLKTWRRWQEEVREGKFEEIIEQFAAGVHPARQGDLLLRATIEAMAHDIGTDVFIKQLKVLESRIDSRPNLFQITCPTLLLVGRQDRITPLELHEEMRDLMHDATLVPIEDCGHYAPLEQPQAVSAVMRYWLQH